MIMRCLVRAIAHLMGRGPIGLEQWWNNTDRGKRKNSGKKSTTYPTWTGPGANPGLRGKWPAANRLSHGTI
jgi:hypothetical protein